MEDKGLQFGSSFQQHSEPSTPTQYSAVRTVRTQGLFSYREDYRTPVDTSNLPPPEPWLEPAIETVETGRMSPCRRDGSWFMKLLHTETKRMEGWCKEMEREAEENDLSEESKNILHHFLLMFAIICQNTLMVRGFSLLFLQYQRCSSEPLDVGSLAADCASWSLELQLRR